MRTGKISESILKRSVLRKIEDRRSEVIKGAGVGRDCAFLSWKEKQPEEMAAAVSAQTVTLPVKSAGRLAVMAAVNNLAAGGAVPAAITVALTLPPDAEEERLKELMVQIEGCCRELDIQIAGGHTEVSAAVNDPIITICALGEALDFPKDIQAGQDMQGLAIVISKWIGLEGTVIIAREKEEQLSERYPVSFIHVAQTFEDRLSVLPEAAIALQSGVYMMHDMRNGGVFGALWEVSQRIGVGLSIDLKEIPVRQETIEICEFYGLNPYELLSGGSLIMVTEDGEGLVEKLTEAGIPACVAGYTTNGNDKVVRNQEETRFLGPAVRDEINKLSFY